MEKKHTPKYIHKNHGKYQVRLPDGEGNYKCIGTYDDLEQAKITRNIYLKKISKKEIDLKKYSANKYPKGITKGSSGRYNARLDIKGKQIYIGSYETINEASEQRKAFILKLL